MYSISCGTEHQIVEQREDSRRGPSMDAPSAAESHALRAADDTRSSRRKEFLSKHDQVSASAEAWRNWDNITLADVKRLMALPEDRQRDFVALPTVDEALGAADGAADPWSFAPEAVRGMRSNREYSGESTCARAACAGLVDDSRFEGFIIGAIVAGVNIESFYFEVE